MKIITTKKVFTSMFVLAIAFMFTGSASAAMLVRQLEQGMSGADVTSLQSFLAQDNSIYPQGLITGFFGPLTKSAVSNFQSRNGIATVGRVGPITLSAINAQMNNPVSMGDVRAATIFNVSVARSNNSAIVSFNTDEAVRGSVYYSSSLLTINESLHDVSINGNVTMTDNTLRTKQDVNITGLSSNTTYYYVIYTKDPSGNVQITWPSTFTTTP